MKDERFEELYRECRPITRKASIRKELAEQSLAAILEEEARTTPEPKGYPEESGHIVSGTYKLREHDDPRHYIKTPGTPNRVVVPKSGVDNYGKW